jgi:TonB-linked SusC/RagA family outer membrane protein
MLTRYKCLVRLKKVPLFVKIAFFMLFFSVGIYAADKTITGIVTDERGEALIGVSVVEVGTSSGTVTNAGGQYSINVSSAGTLKFMYLGYVTQEQRIDSRVVINVAMVEESQKLDEVVVVGYGVQRKSDVTGSISAVSGGDILAAPSFNALEGLRGKAAGVNIFVNTGNPLGVDESGPRVIIRGINSINTSTDPLYVVDGVQMNEIQYINPNNIERIEVLKDASATAIYGARGANGVILVTTKRGSESEGITVSYDGWIKVSTLAKKVDLLNAAEFMKVEETGFANIGKYVKSDSPYIGLTPNRSDPMLFDSSGNPLYDTDWQEEATRNSFSQNHQLSIQQKSKISSVGAFFNYSDEEGIMLNNYAKRLNAKMVYDANAQKWLSINMNLEVNHMWGNGIDDSGGGQVARRTIWEMPPILPVKFPDGSWVNSQFTGNKLNYGLEAMTNPVHELTTRKRNRYRTKIFGNLALIFHLTEGLDLRTQVGVDANVRSNKNYDPNDLINISASDNGKASMYKGERIFWQENTYLSYNRLFNDIHRINATLGMEWSQYTDMENNTGDVKGFSTNFFGYDNLGAGTTPSAPSSNWSRWAMNSYFGRVSYGLKDRYLLTATLRVDGSSRFGANNKYGSFPSAGLGWILTNEPFMQGKASWLGNLKLHTSYGRTGNSEIDSYSTLATLSSGTVLLNGTRVPSGQLSRMPNPDLKWEKTDQFDIGVNLNLFKNRVNIDWDYYYKKTSDLLLSRPIPFTAGFSSVMDNIGRVDNQGIDLLINTVNIESKTFGWESTINLNYNKNEIKKLGENNEDIITDPGFVGGNVILRVGEPLGSFYGYRRLGTWGADEAADAAKVGAVPGEAKRSADREIIGNGLPDVTGSFINKFYYKNLDLIVDMQFVLGVDCWQLFMHSTEDRTGIANGLKSTLYDAWTPTNQNTMVQQIRQQAYAGQNSNSDSHWVANGAYLRGSLIQLGYTVDSKMLKKWNLKKLRLNLSVNNAFLLHSKDFKGYDPEGTSNTARFGQNIFFFEYPRSRDFSLGLNISF